MKKEERIPKKYIALLLAAAIFVCLLPVPTQAASHEPLRINVSDSSTGQPLTEAIVYITTLDGQHRAVNNTDGSYLFVKPDSEETVYDLHISCDGYYARVLENVSADTETLTVALDPCTQTNAWVSFGVYYIANNALPSSYCAPGSSHGNYGPTGDGTPLVEIWVDTSRLRTYTDVYYGENVRHGWTTNSFEFSSAKTSSGDQRLADCQQFWTAVKECMDFQSEQAFRSTGLYDVFIAYSLKEESSWWGNNSYHLDGVLNMEPPVYVVELYAEGSYFGGFVTDARVLEEGTSMEYPTLSDILQAYENHLNQTISWTENDGTAPSFSGTFIRDKYQYTVTVTQTNYNSAKAVENSEINYAEEGTKYYVALFDMTLTNAKQIHFTATYTDGLEYETVFNDQIQTGSPGDTISPFAGSTTREGYLFQGWIIQGGDGTVYTDAQVQEMILQEQDLVFVASYIPLPKEYTVTYDVNGGAGGPALLTVNYNEGTTVTVTDTAPTRTGYRFLGWDSGTGDLLQSGSALTSAISKNYTLTAQWDAITVTFHTNNNDSQTVDVFRIYAPGTEYPLNADGTITPFYDIPEFTYDTHNRYIFKGWYLKDGTALDWTTVFTQDTDVYAHWIEVADVAQEAADGKQNIPNSTYAGFDLAGTQLRYAEANPDPYYDYGAQGSGGGLRFIAVLSETVWEQILNIRPENESTAEYGIVMAKTTTAKNNNETNDPDYQLQYAGVNVNGTDTTNEYWYARNLKCSGLPLDHYNGSTYRLYTAVVTYKSYTAETLPQGHAIAFLTRPYLRYYDANGLYRTHYSNYTEQTHVFYGCSTSYDDVAALTRTVTAGS